MNKKVIETPNSKIIIFGTPVPRDSTHSFCIIIHTRNIDSLKKTLKYIVDNEIYLK